MIYQADKKIPLELTYLIEGIQQYPLSKNERTQLTSYINHLDYNFSLLTPPEIIFLTKSEIYKYLLRKKIVQLNNYQYILSDRSSVETVQNKKFENHKRIFKKYERKQHSFKG